MYLMAVPVPCEITTGDIAYSGSRADGGAATAGAVAALGLRRHAADRGPAPGRRRGGPRQRAALDLVKKVLTRSAPGARRQRPAAPGIGRFPRCPARHTRL